MPGRHLLVAFGPGQSSQQSTASINHQDSHIRNFHKQNSRDISLKVYKDHGTYEQNPLLCRFSISQTFFGSQSFRLKKFKNLLPFCLSEEERNIDRFNENVQVCNRELLVHF